jgi:flagellar biosynthesis protein FlhG
MSAIKNAEKVIPLNRLRPLAGGTPPAPWAGVPRPRTRVLAVTSGKGGVGKTNIVANLGYAMSRSGQRVLLLDADFGLGNLDILLGMAPKFNLSHVIAGEKRMEEIIVDGPGNVRILPASSGIQELTHLTRDQKIDVLTQLDRVLGDVDVFLIDSAAGISANVLDFSVTAHEIFVVVTPEPTSITDAYALMKVLSLKYTGRHCKLMVNMVASELEGREIHRQLNLVAEKFLGITVEYFGSIPYDERLTTCVKRQKVMAEFFPETDTSRCLRQLARKMAALTITQYPQDGATFFWDHILQNGMSSSMRS